MGNGKKNNERDRDDRKRRIYRCYLPWTKQRRERRKIKTNMRGRKRSSTHQGMLHLSSCSQASYLYVVIFPPLHVFDITLSFSLSSPLFLPFSVQPYFFLSLFKTSSLSSFSFSLTPSLSSSFFVYIFSLSQSNFSMNICFFLTSYSLPSKQLYQLF